LTETPPPECEATPIGQQLLVQGVAAVVPVDRLTRRAAAPMRSVKLQKPADHGLLDLKARAQLALFASPGA
jgi:hypothetical protein